MFNNLSLAQPSDPSHQNLETKRPPRRWPDKPNSDDNQKSNLSPSLIRRCVAVRVGAKNPSQVACCVVVKVPPVRHKFKLSKLMKFDPKLNTRIFSGLVNSIDGRNRNLSLNFHSRVTFTLNCHRDGPLPALRCNVPALPKGASCNCDAISEGNRLL